ncbi:DsrE family protein [Labilibaculum sp.]|uniref:DsrE family protein n=1 Tax=Labilibaculum sp. TaxID=2060723 RepID=UPI0035645289
MKYTIIVLLALFSFSQTSFAANSSKDKNVKSEYKADSKEDKLNILWTTSEKETAKNMIAMYAGASLKNKWWSEVNIILWGGSVKLIKEDAEMQEVVRNLIKSGVHVEACHACAGKYDAVDILKSLGADVKYMGKSLTEYIKNGENIITI